MKLLSFIFGPSHEEVMKKYENEQAEILEKEFANPNVFDIKPSSWSPGHFNWKKKEEDMQLLDDTWEVIGSYTNIHGNITCDGHVYKLIGQQKKLQEKSNTYINAQFRVI